jgi:hypothetical protein
MPGQRPLIKGCLWCAFGRECGHGTPPIHRPLRQSRTSESQRSARDNPPCCRSGRGQAANARSQSWPEFCFHFWR